MTKHRIYTLTPNPALDLSGHVASILPNEKNYVTRDRRDPGGNGINAARVARRLGADVSALGFLGGPVGREIQALLKAENVVTRFTSIAGGTRTNVTVTNDSTHQQTRLTFPGPRVSRGEVAALLKQLRSLRGPGLFVLGGSIPDGCPATFHAQVARAASARGLGVAVDVPAKFLKSYLAIKNLPTLFIKPNQHELEDYVGHALSHDADIAQAAIRLTDRARLVCVSLAARGAIVASGSRAWFCASPRVRARGSVGAGDSMVGAIATRLAHWGLTSAEAIDELMLNASRQLPRELEDVLRWGLAAGAATAEAEGTRLADPRRIRALCGNIKISAL